MAGLTPDDSGRAVNLGGRGRQVQRVSAAPHPGSRASVSRAGDEGGRFPPLSAEPAGAETAELAASQAEHGGEARRPELPDPAVLRVRIDDPPLSVDLEPETLPVSRALVRPLNGPGRVGRSAGGSGTGQGTRLEVVVDGWRFEVTVEPARRAALRERATRAGAGGGGGIEVVRAPLPGRVERVWVSAGEAVERGQRLVSLEAMKMENEVLARRAGTVRRVTIVPGVRVELGDELVVIE